MKTKTNRAALSILDEYFPGTRSVEFDKQAIKAMEEYARDQGVPEKGYYMHQLDKIHTLTHEKNTLVKKVKELIKLKEDKKI